MLSPEMRSFLMDGRPNTHTLDVAVRRLGGPAVILAAWGRNKAELLAASPPGVRPWAFWKLQLRLKVVPRSPIDQARTIRTMNLYRDNAERAFVQGLLDEVNRNRRAYRETVRSVA